MRAVRYNTAVSIVVTIVALALVPASRSQATEKDPTNPHLWNPKVRSVAVFKNGLGFFIREDEVELRDGWCVAPHAPPAAFGTLAVYTTDDKQLVDIVGSGPGEIVEFDGHDAADDIATRRERLEACQHIKVSLTTMRGGQTRTAAGTLVSVGPEYAILESESNSFAVPLAEITKLQILELPLRIHVAADDKKVPAKATVGMAHLQKGITWLPEYTMKMIDEDTAELTLRGTLVNEAEDLVHCDVNFVVGVPHFVHTDYLAPVAVGQKIKSIGAAVAPPQITSQIMNRAAVVSNLAGAPQFLSGDRVVDRAIGGGPGDLGRAMGNLPQMTGPAATDYTVFTKKDLTVRRGEKAIVTLFVKTIKFSHIYRWNTAQRMDHYLVLRNDTGTAWTTGPCLGVDGDRPLTEDLLHYTPLGGRAELRVTTAINVAHETSESEVERKLKAHSPSHNYYLDLVTLEGTLMVKNFEKRTATVVVTAAAPGKPLSASDEGRLSVDTTRLKLQERCGTLEWTIALKPGESKVLTYRYERYVPSR
ncbi:MAG: hypothetical protein QGH42_02640 [Kiritimatiellia bacterium]|nr:hypothetical protein [Kiritimatiellia bacterium]MDP6811011.1 hypothetical protein [Kiritimatiellia bacterium]MDP7023134.1 hypothetical protein [Kiritimatiellia bacterium]